MPKKLLPLMLLMVLSGWDATSKLTRLSLVKIEVPLGVDGGTTVEDTLNVTKV
jgi:hypothetical protein